MSLNARRTFYIYSKIRNTWRSGSSWSSSSRRMQQPQAYLPPYTSPYAWRTFCTCSRTRTARSRSRSQRNSSLQATLSLRRKIPPIFRRRPGICSRCPDTRAGVGRDCCRQWLSKWWTQWYWRWCLWSTGRPRCGWVFSPAPDPTPISCSPQLRAYEHCVELPDRIAVPSSGAPIHV